MDGAGHAFVAWPRTTQAEAFLYRAHARVFDGTGPDLREVVVPATGTAGAAVAMSASATDVWSGPPSITWSYGDGGTGAGGSTSHVYAAAGSYVVRATATDGAGNTASVTRTIVVGAPRLLLGTALRRCCPGLGSSRATCPPGSVPG